MESSPEIQSRCVLFPTAVLANEFFFNPPPEVADEGLAEVAEAEINIGAGCEGC
jgi:hypothetical protein